MKLKKMLAAVVACAMTLSLTVFTASAADAIVLVPGEYAGAFIDTSILTVGQKYTMTIQLRLDDGSNGGIRVRYHDNGDVETFSDQAKWGAEDVEGGANANPVDDKFVAAGIPAHIPNDTVAAGETVTMTVNFTFPGGDNTKWISVLGYWGATAFEVLSIELKDASGSVIAAAPPVAAVPLPAEVEPAPAAAELPSYITDGYKVSLSKDLGWINNDNQKGWKTNGCDDETHKLTIEELAAADYIVLELARPLEGGVQFAMQSDGGGGGWAWNQTDAVADVGDTFIIIDLSKVKGGDELADATVGKFLFGYWGADNSKTFDDMRVKNAYLVLPEAPAPAPAPTGETATAPAKTGNTPIVVAVSVMALAGAAAIASKKRK